MSNRNARSAVAKKKRKIQTEYAKENRGSTMFFKREVSQAVPRIQRFNTKPSRLSLSRSPNEEGSWAKTRGPEGRLKRGHAYNFPLSKKKNH